MSCAEFWDNSDFSLTAFFAQSRGHHFVSSLQDFDEAVEQTRCRLDRCHGHGREGGDLAVGRQSRDGNGGSVSSISDKTSLEELGGEGWQVS